MSIKVMRQALEVLTEINEFSTGENAICLPGEIDGAMEGLLAAIERVPRCESCEYWSERAPFDQPFKYIVRQCTSPKFTDNLFPLEFDTDSVIYSEQEDGYFYTGPRFGCVHHKEKNA